MSDEHMAGSINTDHVSQGGIIDISQDGGGEQLTQFGSAPSTPWKRREVIGDATLYLADCMDVMRDMPDKAFDLAIVDPPYGINFAKTHTGNGWTVRDSKQWDKAPPPTSLLSRAFQGNKKSNNLGRELYGQ